VTARIVITTFGSYGDVNPYVGLALGLRERGHEPVIATSPFYRDYVERAGIAFHPVRPDVDPNDRALVARIMDARRGTDFIIRDLLLPSLRDAYEDLSTAAAGADLLVTHPITFAGPIVAEERALAWVSTVLAPMSFFSVHDLPVFPPMPWAKRLERIPGAARLLVGLARTATRSWMEPVRRLRAERGLAPAGDPIYEGQHSPELVLALFSRVLGAPQPDWPEHVRITGPILYNGPPQHGLPEELERFLQAGPAPVVFTLGSSAVSAAGTFYEESAAAAHRAGQRAVLLVGRHAGNRPRDRLSDTIIAVDHAAHAALLPRAAATVHQGGIGTLHQALRAGRPMLIVPYAHDQPDNAHRAARLGVGRVLGPRRYTADRAAAELRELLRDPSYAERASATAATMRTEDGVASACDAIEARLDAASALPSRR
jgi:UDP:flavonoid glycosyltransferase YjiC (YdhE family)